MISLENQQDHNFLQGVVFRLVKKHIAGSTMDAALKSIRDFNSKGLKTTVTFLNEKVDDPTKARYNANAYVQFIKQTSRLHLDTDVSVRLSQLGSKLNGGTMELCIEDLLDSVRDKEMTVWLEAENSIEMESLFDVYRNYKKGNPNLGLEVPIWYQFDVQNVKKHFKSKDKVKFTSYINNANLTLEDKTERKGKKLYDSYISNIGRLLQENVAVSVLEPDEKLVAKIANFSKEYKRNLIFELPLGYTRSGLKKLMKMKANVSVYVPYGKDWEPYAINKLTGSHGRVRKIVAAVLDGKAKSVKNNKELGEKSPQHS